MHLIIGPCSYSLYMHYTITSSNNHTLHDCMLLLGMWVCGINKNTYNVDMMEKIILRVRVTDMRALMV